MFTRISSLSLAILLAVLLWSSINSQQPNFYLLAAGMVVLIFATLAVNFRRLNFTWPHLFLPTLYLAASGSVFAILADRTQQIIFLALASVIFYLLEMKLGRESHFLQNIYLFSVFGLYLALLAFEFYFNLEIWFLAPITFFLTYLFAIQGFAGFSLPSKRYFYFLVSLICTEAVWGLTFWPTHFFVNAVIVFCVFYLLWLFSFSAFFGKLTKEKIYWQLTLVAIVLILVLLTAAWRPLT